MPGELDHTHHGKHLAYPEVASSAPQGWRASPVISWRGSARTFA